MVRAERREVALTDGEADAFVRACDDCNAVVGGHYAVCVWVVETESFSKADISRSLEKGQGDVIDTEPEGKA